ncbi:hypothetical protein [Actinopolymorpha alba]|uniref:hypothetical protein n=1 Tax=Actinopolymorpha alba TaxID=533267 RepID=UPI000381091D|nr:hypothetical protein [Actinopolymorpha alba]
MTSLQKVRSATPLPIAHAAAEVADPPVTLLYPLHGAFAIRDVRRGYVVVELQHGFVTALDEHAVTVTSADGYTRAYQLTAEDLRGFEVLHGVRLTTGCRIVVTASADTPPRILSIDEPREDGTFASGFVPIPRA